MSCKVKKLCNKSNYHRHAARPRTPPDGSGAKSGCRQNDTVCKEQKHTTPAAVRPYAMTENIRPRRKETPRAANAVQHVTKQHETTTQNEPNHLPHIIMTHRPTDMKLVACPSYIIMAAPHHRWAATKILRHADRLPSLDSLSVLREVFRPRELDRAAIACQRHAVVAAGIHLVG